MYSEERQSYINRLIKEKKQVKVWDLAKKLDVSEVTIRKDLSDMERKGVLKRTFGGAIDLTLSVTEKSYNVKKSEFAGEKNKIAQYATSFVAEGMTIFIDAGSTTSFLVKFLKDIRGLKIVTIDLNIALNLLAEGFKFVYFVGGRLSTKTNSSDSVSAALSLSKFNFDLSFIGCDAFSLTNLQTGSESKAKIKEIALKHASLGIVLADSSKFRESGFINFSSVKEVDYIITDGKFKEFSIEDFGNVKDKLLLA